MNARRFEGVAEPATPIIGAERALALEACLTFHCVWV